MASMGYSRHGNGDGRAASPRADEMLKAFMETSMGRLKQLLDTRGMTPETLMDAMDIFAGSLPPLPEEAACVKGCNFCCHLRVGVSIAEAVVIHRVLTDFRSPEQAAFFREKVMETSGSGNTLSDAWWWTSRCSCPFLDTGRDKVCLIYPVRPFSCRAYHATDREACRQGFDAGLRTSIPCFPLYRSAVDSISTVFIQAMAEKGLFSYQVGLVAALDILFAADDVVDRWFAGEDVFCRAAL